MPQLVTADGRRLSYRVRGSGPTLVCHPGGPGMSSLYLEDVAGLDRDVRLVLLDPRGTAGSDRPRDPRAYAIADYANDLEELRRGLGLERMLLLGHSHGGVAAMAYAAAYPDRVERLVLASTLARFAPEQAQAMEAAMQAKDREPWYADARAALEAEYAGAYADDVELGAIILREFPFYFARYGDAERAYLERLRADRPNGDALRLFNAEILPTFDLRGAIRSIRAPTLVIAGSADFITGPLSASEIAAAVPGSRLVILDGVGHFVFVEAAARFRDEVARFLRLS